jgi:hypothetical protein
MLVPILLILAVLIAAAGITYLFWLASLWKKFWKIK